MAQQSRTTTIWQRLMMFLGLGKKAASSETASASSASGVVYDKAITALQGAVQGSVTRVTLDVASSASLDTFASLLAVPSEVKDRGAFTPVHDDLAHLASSPMLHIKIAVDSPDEETIAIANALRSLFSSDDDIITLSELFTMFDLGALVKMSKLMTGFKLTPDAAALLAVAGSIQRQVDPLALLQHISGYTGSTSSSKGGN